MSGAWGQMAEVREVWGRDHRPGMLRPRAGSMFSLEPPGGAGPADTLVGGLPVSRTGRE